MALIECPECRREVSERAAACPECGYPLQAGRSMPPGAVTGSTERRWWPAVDVIGRIVVGGILVLLAASERELGVGTGLVGLLVAASSIPTWYHHGMRRLKAGGADAALVYGLDDRIAELEHRHRDQMADLEERIEFTERLLTKQAEQTGSDTPR